MTNLFVDFETRSTVELTRTGVYPYASHRDTFIWCMAWAFDDEPVALWKEGEPLPERVVLHIMSNGALWAHNAQFERIMWRDCAVRRYAFPPVRDEQWFDTAADAAASGLPRKLADVAAVLDLPVQKDREGNALMQRLCRPRSMNGVDPVWWDDPEKLGRLYSYCRQDVEVEREVWRRVRRLTPHEREVYLLDQKVNDRGIRLDRELASAVRTIAGKEVARLNAALKDATGGAVDKVTKVAKLKAWLAEQGLELDSLRKAVLRDLDRSGLSDDVLVALESRQEAAKSSLAKIDAMFDCVGDDDQMRGLLKYHAAHTGRWSSYLVQLHNLPTALDVPNAEQYVPWALGKQVPDVYLSADGTKSFALSPNQFMPPVMSVCAALLRPMITARPGHRLLAADFSAIEARALAWLARSELMLEQFAQGRPIYKEMAATIYGTSADAIVKPSPEYRLGKDTVLGCGFGMGWKKFVTQTKEKSGVVVPDELGKLAVDTYRATYPEVPLFWRRVNAAALDAVTYPKEVFTVNDRVRFTARNGFLWVVLPSGRPIGYYRPKVVQRVLPWSESETAPAVEYSGYSNYTHQWERLTLYGGLITENIVQAVARDLLADAMLRVEAAGYPVVLTVHDEVVAEVGDTKQGLLELVSRSGAYGEDAYEASLDDFLALMHEVPAWARGLPVAAEGWEGARYRK